MELRTTFPLVDEILHSFAAPLGNDLVAYRNHVCRVLNYLRVLAPEANADLGRLQIAAAFHDLGIWTDRTFDYLEPSKRLARDYLASHGLAHFAPEIQAIIDHHHQLTPYRGVFSSSVEPFRRADLVDVSLGAIRFRVSRGFVRVVKTAFPNAGFHRRLLSLTWHQVLRHPLRPLPMVRW